jgi:hypothetical protein
VFVCVQLSTLKSLFKMIMQRCMELKGSKKSSFLPVFLLQLVELVVCAHATQKVPTTHPRANRGVTLS